jgi:hypothetical protein
MNADVVPQHTLSLTERERVVLQEMLEEALKVAEVEEHRTDAFLAKEVVRARERTIEALLQKVVRP